MDWMDNPGTMDQKLNVQYRTKSRSASGTITETWPVVAHIWGKRVRNSGSEKEENHQQTAGTKVEFHVYFFMYANEELNPKNFRFQRGSKIYDIKFVEEIGFRKLYRVETMEYDAETYDELNS